MSLSASTSDVLVSKTQSSSVVTEKQTLLTAKLKGLFIRSRNESKPVTPKEIPSEKDQRLSVSIDETQAQSRKNASPQSTRAEVGLGQRSAALDSSMNHVPSSSVAPEPQEKNVVSTETEKKASLRPLGTHSVNQVGFKAVIGSGHQTKEAASLKDISKSTEPKKIEESTPSSSDVQSVSSKNVEPMPPQVTHPTQSSETLQDRDSGISSSVSEDSVIHVPSPSVVPEYLNVTVDLNDPRFEKNDPAGALVRGL